MNDGKKTYQILASQVSFIKGIYSLQTQKIRVAGGVFMHFFVIFARCKVSVISHVVDL